MLPPEPTSWRRRVPSPPINSTMTRHFIPLPRSAVTSLTHTTPTFEPVSIALGYVNPIAAHPPQLNSAARPQHCQRTRLPHGIHRISGLNSVLAKADRFHWYHNILVILVLPAGHVAAEDATVPLKNRRKRGVGGAVLPAVPSLEMRRNANVEAAACQLWISVRVRPRRRLGGRRGGYLPASASHCRGR